jgi:hypothetical protein
MKGDRMYKVVDANGRQIELEDHEIVPDGCRLMVSPLFMDSLDQVQRLVFNDSADDASTDERRRVIADAEQRRADAYSEFKRGLDTANNRTARQSVPPVPSWQKSPWRRRKGVEAGPAAGDAAPEGSDRLTNLRRAFGDKTSAASAASVAYEARNEYLRNAWKQKG